MRRIMKRVLAVLLMISMLVSLYACGGKPDSENGKKAEKQESSGSETALSENVIIDGAGIIRELPGHPEEITIASVYAVSVPLLEALGVTDRVVAINLKSKFWAAADPNLDLPTIGKGVVDMEAIASLNPGVFIHRSNDPETIEAVENIGIPTICITIENMEDIKTALTYLGKYLGAEESALKAISWIEEKYQKIDEIVAKIPVDERKTALLMGGEPGRVAGNDMLQSWMIEKAGGICVADSGEDHSWINVGLEKVFEWNPEVLFCTSSTMLDYSKEELMSDPTWADMKAVRDAQIYVMPAKKDSWDMPGLSSVLGTFYMLSVMYPEYFSEEELEAEIDEYYTFMFGRTFQGEEIGYEK